MSIGFAGRRASRQEFCPSDGDTRRDEHTMNPPYRFIERRTRDHADAVRPRRPPTWVGRTATCPIGRTGRAAPRCARLTREPESHVSGASYDSMRAHHGSTSVIEPAQHMNHHYHQQHGLAGGAGGSAVYPNVGFRGIGAMSTSALPPQPMTLPVSSAQHAIHYSTDLGICKAAAAQSD